MPLKFCSPAARVPRVIFILLTVVALFTLAAFAQDRREKEERDNPVEREQWFMRGRLFHGKPAPQLRTELGPAPMRSVSTVGDDGDYGLVTGRATTVAVDQNDTSGNTVYLGGAFGGVWKSTSAANSDPSKGFWKPVIDDQPTIAVGSIAV